MALDDHERKVVVDVARVGWSLALIPADDEEPALAYSIGMMQSLDHPEVVMFGLDVNVMAGVINQMGQEIRDGRRFDAGGLYDGLLKGYACKCVPVDERFHKEHLGGALWHRRHVGKPGTLRAVQCLWPDKAGLFPDKPGCHPAVAGRQPILSDH